MFPLLRTLTGRYLLQRKARAVLVALSIALGVGTLVSSRLLNQCVEIAVLDTTVPADVADLYVENGEAGVPLALADELRKAAVPGVKRVEPVAIFSVTLPELNDRPARVMGFDVVSAALAGGKLPDPADPAAGLQSELLRRLGVEVKWVNKESRNPRSVVISRKLYDARKAAGRADADPIALQYTTAAQRFPVVAYLDIRKDSPVAPYADALVLMDIRPAIGLLGRAEGPSKGRVNRIDLFLDRSVEPDAVRDRVSAVVAGRANVRFPEETRKSTTEVIGGIKLVLNLCSVGALVVGLFLVYNALSVTVAERRHDIGVMRSLGATRPQIAGLFAAEAMLLGAVGALPGIPLGIGLAELAIRQFDEELQAVFPGGASFRPELSMTTAAVAVAAGMLTALFAALVPALRAASDEPADAVRRAPTRGAGLVWWAHRSACVALVLGGMATVYFRASLPSRTGSLVGMTLVLTGLFLAMPVFVRWLAGLLHPVCRSLMGVEARLAADNLIRSPARTGVVIGALAAGVSLMFQTAGVGKSNEVPIREWLAQVLQADAYLFRGNMASANSSISPMEESVRTELEALPGVEGVVGIRFYRPEYHGTFVLVVGIDARPYHRGVRERLPDALPELDLFGRLPDGDYCTISDNFAAKWKVKTGDTITIPGPRGPVNLTVIGKGKDYSWSQGTIFVDRARFAELFDDRLIDAAHVFFRRDADYDATYETVREYSERRGLLVQDQQSVNVYLSGVIRRMFQLAYLQQLIVAVVAALGVVTALLISVLQRRRELGLLRAVGATQVQVLKSVLAEAMLMGLLGTVLGFGLGLPMEWYLLDVVMREETGFVFDLLVPWKEALGIGAICVLTSTLAGLVPAIHAVRLRIPDAIAYE